jgi:prepilin-type N-terminal cleavage/methylation domain-containing protein
MVKKSRRTTFAVGNSTGFAEVGAASRAAPYRGRPRLGRPTGFTPVELPVVSERKRVAFTLVELLVVVAIIGILVALLLPAIQSAREAARRSQCQNHMKQIGLGTLNFENTRKYLPPSKWYEYRPQPGSIIKRVVSSTTLTYLLPYVEETALANEYSFDMLWDDSVRATNQSKSNHELNQTPVPVFRCPSAPQERATINSAGVSFANTAAVDYRVCDAYAAPGATCSSHAGGKCALEEEIDANKVKARPNSRGGYYSVLWNESSLADPTKSQHAKLKQTTDGLSQSMMWFETGGAPLKYKDGVLQQNASIGSTATGETQGGSSWADADSWYVIHDRCGDSFFNCNNNEEIYSFHNGGAYFGFGDGAIHFVSTDINPDVFVSLFTRDSSDVIADNPF